MIAPEKKRYSILVVDDEETIRELLKMIFAEDDYDITTAALIQEAMAHLDQRPFDVVITDKNVPDGSGFDVARHVRKLGHDTEIIIITAYANIESAVEAMRLGVADYVEKPFRDFDAVRHTVNRALEILTLKRSNRRLVADLKSKNQELEALATTDPLTKLFNHAFFQQALDREIVRSSRHQEEFGLLFIDLDDFKLINDSLGHLAGDKLLAGFAMLLHGQVRRSDLSFRLRAQDIAARYGGDEFAIILPETPKHGAATKAERLRQLMDEHGATLMNIPVRQTLSIGVAAYPQDGTDRTRLIEVADRCLYAAKRAGRNRIVACNEEVLSSQATTGTAAVMSAELVDALHRTLTAESVDFVYQPIVAAETGQVVAYEAFCRPRDPAFPDPMRLLTAAENAGKIGELGRILRRKAVTALERLGDDISLFINLHPQELNDPDLATLDPALAQFAHRVVFEYTNTQGIRDRERARRILQRLREAGFRVGLDDLGSGYLGLDNMAVLEPDFAKLHRDLVNGLLDNRRTRRFVKHVVEFAAAEGMQLIAGGVETEAEAAAITELGCPLLQGYLFGKPKPIDEL